MPSLKPLWLLIGVLLLVLIGLQVAPAHAASTCPSPASSAKITVAPTCPISPSPAVVTFAPPAPSDPSQVTASAGILPPVTGDGSSQSPRSFTMLALGLGVGLLAGLVIGSFVGWRRHRA